VSALHEASDAPGFVDTGGLDAHLARLLARLNGDADPLLRLAVRLVSSATSQGHVCVNLADAAGGVMAATDEAALEPVPPLSVWCEALRRHAVVGRPGDYAPLILDDAGRLYLYRYWAYEQELATDLRARVADDPADVDPRRLRGGLDRLFPPTGDAEDRQRVAAAVAALKRFTVISGGPGTGKTTTVVRILALLLEQAATPLRIALAAPTGKAAARMQEAIRASRETLPVDARVRDAIPVEATTIHRLLGFRPGSVTFRHDREDPLPVDVLVVDEASMVDLALMAKLVRAVPGPARLILLGDKDQLASVEAGAVLGDICGDSPGFSSAFRRRLIELTGQDPADLGSAASRDEPAAGPPIRDAIVQLTRSYRFGRDSGIGRLAFLVNRGDGPAALDLLTRGGCDDLVWHPLESPRTLAARLAGIAPRLGAYLNGGTPETALAALDRFRVLSVHRTGPYGVETLNALIATSLEARGGMHPRGLWYHGRPVLVTANDYNLRLFNGDLGITLRDAEAEHKLRIFFRGADGRPRRLSPARLPEHETAFAATVHKSQGSEAEGVLLILPNALSPVMTRELLYTGITRARSSVEIWATPEIFEAAVARRLARSSGLRDALWSAGPDSSRRIREKSGMHDE
jgi:exodeoxyribonuclease V alpha subunit